MGEFDRQGRKDEEVTGVFEKARFSTESGETHAGGRALGGDEEKQHGTESAGGTPGAEKGSAQ